MSQAILGIFRIYINSRTIHQFTVAFSCHHVVIKCAISLKIWSLLNAASIFIICLERTQYILLRHRCTYFEINVGRQRLGCA